MSKENNWVFKPLKLSEAIREGAKLHPQGKHDFIAPLINGGYATCALGAARVACLDGPYIAYATHGDFSKEMADWYWHHTNIMSTYWRRIYEVRFVDPATLPSEVLPHLAHKPASNDPVWLANIITTLNDAVGWTREQIADWVESVEKSLGDSAYPRTVEEIIGHER